jgi:hypothetical protein
MSKIRGHPFTRQQAAERYNHHIRELQENLRSAAENQVRGLLTPSRSFEVELLPTSDDFYAAGVTHYRRSYGTRRLFTIFSTTPGVMLPEERYGTGFLDHALKQSAAPTLRHDLMTVERYFRALSEASRGKPRLYHFELYRAKRQYEETLSRLNREEREQYEEHSMRLLEPFLSDPDFGLVRIRRFPSDFDYLTLGNGASVVISGRKEGRIYRGLWVRPERNDILKQAVGEINLGNAFKQAVATLIGYVAAGETVSKPLPELEQIALTLFYAPLAYLLIRGARWRPGTAGTAFENLTDRLRAQVGPSDYEVVKPLGQKHPLMRVESLQDLFA